MGEALRNMLDELGDWWERINGMPLPNAR